MRAQFDHSISETSTISTFWFRTERRMGYTAGQFTELTLPHDNPDDRGTKRWFTISSAPDQELLSITTKFAAPDKSSSFKRALLSLTPGQTVDLHDAMGDFVLPMDESTPLVFVAGGIGITPFNSMLLWLANNHQSRHITLLYGVSSESEIVFQSTFEQTHVKPVVVVSNPASDWRGERGLISAEVILRLAKPSNHALIYVSGPEPMTEALQLDLQAHGIANNRLVTDFFPGYTGL